MSGNLALKALILPALYTGTGAVALGFDGTSVTNNLYPQDFMAISAASALTITLPPARLTNYSALGGGNGQTLQFGNYAAQAVSCVAASGDTIVGLTTTIAQNTTISYEADAVNNRWFRKSA